MSTEQTLRNADRLDALRRTALLDTPNEPAFDRLTRVAATALGVPIALVSLVDTDRQFFKSQMGLPILYAKTRQTPLSHSLCKHVAMSSEPLVINDARLDSQYSDNGAVADLGVVAYAGFPLVIDGQTIGSFCAIDVEPRAWSESHLGVLRDLAAVVMSEIELKRALESAESANRAKDRFLAMLSHELRTPLSPALLICGSLAADPSLPPHVRDDLRTVERNVQQQTRLIDDLLDVTRIENGKLSLQVEELDLHELLSEVVTASRSDADGRRVELKLSTDAKRHTISADPARMRQVFSNLIRNAVKFTPAGGNVSVRTVDGSDDSVTVTVTDTGIGIQPEVLPNVFNIFEQGSRSITDEFSGLGLGLAICRGLVEAAGGTICAQSDGPGTGATFMTVLPTIERTSREPTSSGEPAGRSSTRNILLVEDHRDTLRLMVRLLTKQGHRVTGVETMAAALAAADADPAFDLLISDVDLPDGSGLDLMAELSRRRPIAGITLTGYGMEADVANSRSVGFSAHLVKPLNFKDLEAAIAALT